MNKKDEFLAEVGQLQTMWNRFIDHIQNDPNIAMHAPPALAECISSLSAHHMGALNLNPKDEDTFNRISYLNEMFFYFGQFAHQNGLYRSNLTPCDCGTVDDDSIKAFFEGVAFTKEDE